MRRSRCCFRSIRPASGPRARSRSTKGKNEGVYPLNANGERGDRQVADDGDRRRRYRRPGLGLFATCRVGSRRSLRRLRHETRGVRQGPAAQIQCTLAHNTPFEGNAKAELLGLPPGVSAAPVEFTKETKELAFRGEDDQGHAGRHSQVVVLPGDDHAKRRADRRHGRHDRAARERAAGRGPDAGPSGRCSNAGRRAAGREADVALGAAPRQGPSGAGKETMNEVGLVIIALRLAIGMAAVPPAAVAGQSFANGTTRLSQPVIARSFDIEALDEGGEWVCVAQVRNNYQRLVKVALRDLAAQAVAWLSPARAGARSRCTCSRSTCGSNLRSVFALT